MKLIIELRLLVNINRNGEVIDVQNSENFFNVVDDFAEISVAQRREMKKMLKNSYGEKALKDNMKIGMIIFPTQDITIGSHWTVVNSIESGTPTEINTTYTLKDITADYYLIAGSSKIASLNKDTYIERSGMEIKSDLSGTMSATYKINKKTGWVIEVQTDQQIKGNSYIKESEMMPSGMSMPIELNSKVKILGN